MQLRYNIAFLTFVQLGTGQNMSCLRCRGLQNGELDADLVAEALTKLLGTGVAADGLLSYCLMALETPAPALRHLAVRQLGSILQASTPVTGMQHDSGAHRCMRASHH